VDDLLNPYLDDGERLLEMKKYMIANHPSFFCPLSKKMLDYRTSYIVKFDHEGKRKTDIISVEGYEKIPLEVRERTNLKIVENWEEI